ncbi:peptidase family M50-domain-containing protein, partial [Ochromonadaceae sp. CCMP2298]
ILVAVHEWGHFWVARRCGVKVQRYSIGFGKALWRRTDKLGTEYVIAAIPLGGYVKMLDERVDEPVVGSIQPDSVFSQVNIPKNAILTQVGDRKVVDWEDVAYEFMSFIGHDEMHVKWTDEKTTFERSATINLSEWKFDPDKTSVFSSLGLIPFRPKVLNVLGSVQDGSAAQSIGFQANDKIVSLDGTSMQNWEQIVGYVSTRPNQAVEASVLRNEQIISLNGTIGSKTVEQTTKGYMGFTPTLEPWPEGVVFVHQYGVVKAMSKAMDKTWRLMTLSIEML